MVAIILQFSLQSLHVLQISARLGLMSTALFHHLLLMKEYQVPLLVHLILDRVSKDCDENGGKILLCTEFGGLDVWIRLLVDKDV